MRRGCKGADDWLECPRKRCVHIIPGILGTAFQKSQHGISGTKRRTKQGPPGMIKSVALIVRASGAVPLQTPRAQERVPDDGVRGGRHPGVLPLPLLPPHVCQISVRSLFSRPAMARRARKAWNKRNGPGLGRYRFYFSEAPELGRRASPDQISISRLGFS